MGQWTDGDDVDRSHALLAWCMQRKKSSVRGGAGECYLRMRHLTTSSTYTRMGESGDLLCNGEGGCHATI